MGIDNIKMRLRQLIWATNPELYWKAVQPRKGQVFSIGIMQSASSIDLLSNTCPVTPVLTSADIKDLPASFVADPFMICVDKCWYMFFEILNSITRKGEIGYATSSNGKEWAYQSSVLSESFHLAYPFVFKWRDEIYMVPDSPGHGIRMYRADRFPHKWVLVNELRTDGHFSDTSLLHHEDKWWMFTTWTSPDGEQEHLRLYSAFAPCGPWQEHPESPIISQDPSSSRAAGRPLTIGNRIYRFAQDCSRVYGESVNAFEITVLTEDNYVESKVDQPVLMAGKSEWNQHGMHHIDAHLINGEQWFACVDGWFMATGNE